MPQTVLIAGATGYLGRYLVAEYALRGWTVIALVRNVERAPSEATRIIQAEVTNPETLKGILEGVNVVVSAVGITRQRDGLTYQQVDYQANVNLLQEAIQAKVRHFGYIHVLHGQDMAHLPAISAKQDFVIELQKASENKLIQSTVIAPCGFFSDMKDFLDMAKNGRAYLFGDGSHTINPIHGADLAQATADAIDKGRTWIDIGGPDVFTQKELAECAFEALDKPVKITYIWDKVRTNLIAVLPWISPLSVYGPVQFFLFAMGRDMVGDCHGEHHLKEYFADVVQEEAQQEQPPKESISCCQ